MIRWISKQARHAKIRAAHSRRPEAAATAEAADHPSKGPQPGKGYRRIPHGGPPYAPSEQVHPDLSSNEAYLREALGDNDSILYRRFQVGVSVKRAAMIVAVSGIVEKKILNEGVISSLMKTELPADGGVLLQYLQESVLAVIDIQTTDELPYVIELILQGCAALFLEGEDDVLLIPVGEWKSRAIDQPLSETVIRGPRDSFVEDINTNISLLRKRIHHPKLRLETMLIGSVTQTKVSLVWIDGIVDNGIVEEARKRLSRIEVDAVLESGYIEQYIEDARFSIFPTIAHTEKPDIVAARILEGRIAIFVDGTPIVLTAPDLLISHFHVSEDYYARPFYASLVRLLRVLSFFTTIMLPGLFLSVEYYHPVLIPYTLLVSLAKAREGVPFQLYIEVIIMILVFEVIREAGLRMPRPIGQAVSIVGAIILGQSAVEAGLVGIPVVVIVAFAGVSTFLINTLAEPISILRLLFAIAGSLLGIYGILLLGMVVVTHLATLRSFGVPYAAPLFPIVWKDWKDTIFRFPLQMMWHRPKTLNPANYQRKSRGGLIRDKKPKKNN